MGSMKEKGRKGKRASFADFERAHFERGVRTAAQLASEYDGASANPYRIEDCILGKLNVKGARIKARKNTRSQVVARTALAEAEDRALTRGFGLALSEMQQRFDQSSLVAEVCQAFGKATMKDFKEAGLEAYDLKHLRKCLPKVQAPKTKAKKAKRTA